MNIKLHTPKTLKNGSGMGSMKQFMLSLLATTVSIVLTFGTAAIIDNNKKQKEKREIVMMVMYDMYNSLQSVQRADSMIRESMELQLQIAKDTSKFNTLKFNMIHKVPRIEFTETTERIFSTSIETINTVGNVLFTENVAEFYQARKLYKAVICDSINNRMVCNMPFVSLKGTLDFDYSYEFIVSGEIRMSMQNLFAQCKRMMDVNDEEIEAYRMERKQLQEESADESAKEDSIAKKILQRDQELREAKKKLKLE
ncbi:MAG: hypothetical protein II061_02760 [Bacteroidaceae bacterium]|nr:hypothetical protein [Bacteroidaceae bacterium]